MNSPRFTRRLLVILAGWCWVAAAERVQAELLSFSKDKSSIQFVGSKPGVQHAGKFTEFRGGFDSESGSLSLTIDLASIATDDQKLTQHLLSADFFNVGQFPTATFRSTKLRPGPQESRFVIDGEFSLLGVTRPISVPATITWQGTAIHVAGQVVLKRSDFGMTFGLPGINDEVPIQFLLVSEPKSSETVATAAAAAATAPLTQRLVIDGQRSKIEFRGSKPGVEHFGHFAAVSGEFDLGQQKLLVKVDVASLTADDPKLTQHLLSPDFFDAARFPVAQLQSTSIEAHLQPGSTHLIRGSLQIHSVTKPIAVPCTMSWQGNSLVISGAHTIRRSDFGIDYGLGQIDDEVPLRFTVTATPTPQTQQRLATKPGTGANPLTCGSNQRSSSTTLLLSSV